MQGIVVARSKVGFNILTREGITDTAAEKMLDWCRAHGVRLMTLGMSNIAWSYEEKQAVIDFWMPKLIARDMNIIFFMQEIYWHDISVPLDVAREYTHFVRLLDMIRPYWENVRAVGYGWEANMMMDNGYSQSEIEGYLGAIRAQLKPLVADKPLITKSSGIDGVAVTQPSYSDEACFDLYVTYPPITWNATPPEQMDWWVQGSGIISDAWKPIWITEFNAWSSPAVEGNTGTWMEHPEWFG
jgi:hypothetical protein